MILPQPWTKWNSFTTGMFYPWLTLYQLISWTCLGGGGDRICTCNPFTRRLYASSDPVFTEARWLMPCYRFSNITCLDFLLWRRTQEPAGYRPKLLFGHTSSHKETSHCINIVIKQIYVIHIPQPFVRNTWKSYLQSTVSKLGYRIVLFFCHLWKMLHRVFRSWEVCV